MRKWEFALSSADEAALSAPILLRGDIGNNLIQAAQLGYHALEVHTRETMLWDYSSLDNIMEENNMKISAVVTGRLNTEGQVNLIDDIPYITQSAITGMKQYIEMAERLKTNLVVGWVKGKIPAGGNEKRYLDRLSYNLKLLDDYAGARGVRLFLEVINRYETNIFNTAEATMEFIETRKLDNCFVHLDTFHMGIDETDPVAAIKLCGNKLGYMHFADNTRCYPGSGQIDFRKILQALDAADYKGYLSVECLPKPDGMTAAEHAIKHLLECIASN
jgi:Sugar phosphate isomerases/epimerases